MNDVLNKTFDWFLAKKKTKLTAKNEILTMHTKFSQF